MMPYDMTGPQWVNKSRSNVQSSPEPHWHLFIAEHVHSLVAPAWVGPVMLSCGVWLHAWCHYKIPTTWAPAYQFLTHCHGDYYHYQILTQDEVRPPVSQAQPTLKEAQEGIKLWHSEDNQTQACPHIWASGEAAESGLWPAAAVGQQDCWHGNTQAAGWEGPTGGTAATDRDATGRAPTHLQHVPWVCQPQNPAAGCAGDECLDGASQESAVVARGIQEQVRAKTRYNHNFGARHVTSQVRGKTRSSPSRGHSPHLVIYLGTLCWYRLLLEPHNFQRDNIWLLLNHHHSSYLFSPTIINFIHQS